MINKNKILIMLPILAAIMLTAFKCGGGNEPPEPVNNKIQFTVIGQGDLNDSESLLEQYSLITNSSDWATLIAAMDAYNHTSNTFTEINIDFSQFNIIAVIDEVKGNGGWTIDITDITEYSDNIVVTLENLEKGNISNMMTQPFQIVKIPATNKEIIFNKTLNENNDSVDYPIDIPFTKYLLMGPTNGLCTWNCVELDTFPYIHYQKWAIINNNNELESYISCFSGSNYPEIDFSKKTLLLAYGMDSSPNSLDFVSLQQLSPQHYEMKVHLLPSEHAVILCWEVPIIIDKIVDGSTVDLIVTQRWF